MLLPKRKAALLQATHGQRICWELLRALDKGICISRERHSEVAAALKRIRENGQARFTQEPDKGEEIYDKIAAKVDEQVAARATNEIRRHWSDGQGGSANNANQGNANLNRSEKPCWDFTFGECTQGSKCEFNHPQGGQEAALKQMLAAMGEVGVSRAKAAWRKKPKPDTAPTSSANNAEAKGQAPNAPKTYKMIVAAKGSVHMLQALRAREVNGSARSTHVRRIMRAQGRLPEARHPNGFSRWDEVEGEWIEDSDNDEPAPTGSIGGSNWDMPELMPELSHDDDDEVEFEPARDDDLWQPLMLSLLDMPILSEVPSVSSVSLPTNAFIGSIDVAHAYMDCELDEEQGYMGRPGLDNEVDEHAVNSTRLEAQGHAFVTNVDGSTQAVAPQPDANAAREHTHDGITDFVEGVFNAIYRALLWAAGTLVETVDAVADMVGYTRAGHTQGASANNEGTE